MELSPENYEELMQLYVEKMRRLGKANPSNEVIPYNTYSESDAKVNQALRDVACHWLNKETRLANGKVRRNYERWGDVGPKKKKLKIGGIFPYTGIKYSAPELLPGSFKIIWFECFKQNCFVLQWPNLP